VLFDIGSSACACYQCPSCLATPAPQLGTCRAAAVELFKWCTRGGGADKPTSAQLLREVQKLFQEGPEEGPDADGEEAAVDYDTAAAVAAATLQAELETLRAGGALWRTTATTATIVFPFRHCHYR